MKISKIAIAFCILAFGYAGAASAALGANGFTPNGFTPNGIGWNSASPAWSQGARSNSTHAFMQLPQLAKASLAE